MAIPQRLPLTKKSSSETGKLLPPSFLSKWCECQIQSRANNTEHGRNFLLLCYLKAKQQLASHAKGIKLKITTNSLWMLMLLKTYIALGQMVALCNVLHWGEKLTVQQGLFVWLRLTYTQQSSGFNESCSTIIDGLWLLPHLSPPTTSAQWVGTGDTFASSLPYLYGPH